MKTILIALSAVALLFCSTSCRISAPIDPNTGRQDPSLVPEGNSPLGYSMPQKDTKKVVVESSK